MSLFSRRLSAETAALWGLVQRTVDAASLLDEARQLVRIMFAMQPAMLREYRRLIDEGYSMYFASALRFERVGSACWTETIAQGLAAIDAKIPLTGERDPADRPGSRVASR